MIQIKTVIRLQRHQNIPKCTSAESLTDTSQCFTHSSRLQNVTISGATFSLTGFAFSRKTSASSGLVLTIWTQSWVSSSRRKKTSHSNCLVATACTVLRLDTRINYQRGDQWGHIALSSFTPPSSFSFLLKQWCRTQPKQIGFIHAFSERIEFLYDGAGV